MDFNQIIEKIKPELQNIVDFFKSECSSMHSGRLSVGLIDDIKVDCSGATMDLKQIGAISIPSPHEILIQLWSELYIEPAVRAIENKNFGFGVRVEGNNIYLSAPPLTEERKENLIRLLGQKKEEVFQNIRRQRDKTWKEIQDSFQKGEIREDDKFKGKDKLEEVVKEYKDKIEEIAKNKEKEIQG